MDCSIVPGADPSCAGGVAPGVTCSEGDRPRALPSGDSSQIIDRGIRSRALKVRRRIDELMPRCAAAPGRLRELVASISFAPPAASLDPPPRRRGLPAPG
jgi:hypothetical protein